MRTGWLAVVLLVACSGGGGGSSDPVATGTSDPGVAGLSGTLGGKAFVPKSGLGYLSKDGTLTLSFSDFADVCAATTAAKFHAGETRLSMYRLGVGTGIDPKAAVGEKLTTYDSKYGRITADCPSGEAVTDKRAEKQDRAKTTEVTMTKLGPDRFEGTLTTTYDDGSTLSGSFQVAACSIGDNETSYCF